jgi:hypothetical protein
MKNVFVRMSAVIALSIGTLTYAQDPPAQQQQPAERQRQRSQDEGTPTMIRGCLTKGSQAQEYVVADEKSGEKVAFGGPAKLDSYVNQTVEVTGQMTDRGGEKAFQPQAIKSVAATCKAASEK